MGQEQTLFSTYQKCLVLLKIKKKKTKAQNSARCSICSRNRKILILQFLHSSQVPSPLAPHMTSFVAPGTAYTLAELDHCAYCMAVLCTCAPCQAQLLPNAFYLPAHLAGASLQSAASFSKAACLYLVSQVWLKSASKLKRYLSAFPLSSSFQNRQTMQLRKSCFLWKQN